MIRLVGLTIYIPLIMHNTMKLQKRWHNRLAAITILATVSFAHRPSDCSACRRRFILATLSVIGVGSATAYCCRRLVDYCSRLGRVSGHSSPGHSFHRSLFPLSIVENGKNDRGESWPGEEYPGGEECLTFTRQSATILVPVHFEFPHSKYIIPFFFILSVKLKNSSLSDVIL